MSSTHHTHDNTTPQDPNEDPATFWENRYSGPVPSWSGRANAALEREAAGLTPGTALDLGCGEGGDAIWLARGGWRVTGVDISASALALGEATAVSGGVGESIRWLQADLAVWQPDANYDLVTAHFLHSPVELPREVILRRAANAVAPGGLLLVVGHAGVPPWAEQAHGHGHEDAQNQGHDQGHDGSAMPTPEEVLASLNLTMSEWTVVTCALVERSATMPDGSQIALPDSVLSLRRTPAPAAVPAAD
ncbi:class I SAM-dependent methyltransferase [Cryobacterium frigoriphilum]|uniref:Class I SAM-dependent methyltransferase n=1 Tax=Cryobacterium frigoriphilum TaxID=1259150 RepID=A0A4R8ZTP9_9MICO|nr:class I SAM-dependent methyltransferase [Cryobacterium frigoriphilum]TFD45127.1 class I SAM-dependent methyltransferase [Cryobacterium frigoriphilum]